MSPQIIPLKGRTDLRVQAEFWPPRLRAFELRRWGNAARALCCRDFSKRYTPMLTIERHRGDTLMAIAYSGSVPLNTGNRTNDGASGCLVAQGRAVERT